MRIGVTGHQTLPKQEVWRWVGDQMDEVIRTIQRPLVGLTSLAIGADQLFAERILAAAGQLYIVIPHSDYEATFRTQRARDHYRELLVQATQTEALNISGSREDAYLQAGHRIADLSDILVAVWNGRPAAGRGGTADAVDYALAKSTLVIHINPVTGTASELH